MPDDAELRCPRCSAAVLPDGHVCARCGRRLPGKEGARLASGSKRHLLDFSADGPHHIACIKCDATWASIDEVDLDEECPAPD